MFSSKNRQKDRGCARMLPPSSSKYSTSIVAYFGRGSSANLFRQEQVSPSTCEGKWLWSDLKSDLYTPRRVHNISLQEV